MICRTRRRTRRRPRHLSQLSGRMNNYVFVSVKADAPDRHGGVVSWEPLRERLTRNPMS